MGTTASIPAQAQYIIECHNCKNHVAFFCKRCGVNLCDPCVPIHLRIKSKTGHDVVDYAIRDDVGTHTCNSHPQRECCVYCHTCDVPICMFCVLNKHKSHQLSELLTKMENLMKIISKENERLQKSKHEFEKILDHTSQRLFSLSKTYQIKKEEVTLRGEEWHRQIDKTVKTLHQELDDMQKEHESLLQKQKAELEDILGRIDEINTTAMKLEKSQNLLEMRKCISMIKTQGPPAEISQLSLPVFCECEIDDNYLKSYFGYIEKIKERRISLSRLIFEDAAISIRKILEVPKVITDIYVDTGDKEFDLLGCDIAVINYNKMWIGGANRKLKLFDFQGNLRDTVFITAGGIFLAVYNENVIYSGINTVHRVADDKAIHTMFATGEWTPRGIASTASNDLLVCLLRGDQSKVVRYSSCGTELQEIQYDSQGQPLYRKLAYITENINGDIIVTDWSKNAVIAVNRLGTFRFSYSGRNNTSTVIAVTTDPAGHVIVTDLFDNKIHMLDGDGRFLRYIIPDQGIKCPQAVCVFGDGEMFVVETKTCIIKRIKYM